jgi:hypothetical protein
MTIYTVAFSTHGTKKVRRYSRPGHSAQAFQDLIDLIELQNHSVKLLFIEASIPGGFSDTYLG